VRTRLGALVEKTVASKEVVGDENKKWIDQMLGEFGQEMTFPLTMGDGRVVTMGMH